MDRLQPQQSYYPSARVRLIIRFEDYGDPDTPRPPEKPPQLRQGTGKDAGGTLQVVEQDGALVLVAPGDDPYAVGTPQEQHASLDGYTHVLEGVLPVGASLGRNGIRTADTLSLDIKFRDLPLDPRAVRSCGVEFFLGTVTPQQYERGVAGERRANGQPFHLVTDNYLDDQGRLRTNLRFQGWVDNWEVDWPADNETLVTLECTDNTRLLLDQEHPPGMAVAVDAPIDRAIAQYLANFPQFRGLRVEFRPEGAERPVLEKVLTKAAYPKGVGPSAATGGDSKLSCWDYLTDVVGSLGLTLRMQGVTIIIQRARTLYANKFVGREDDPFRGRTLPSGRVLSRRLFVYGHNVESIRGRREYAKGSPTNVEVRCYSSKRKKTLIARYPTFTGKKQKKLLPGETAEQKFTVVRVTGIEDEATLRVVAQTSYETLGRRELEFQVDTKNLASLGGHNLDPDILDAQEGDAIDVELKRDDPAEQTSSQAFIEQQLQQRPVEFLQQLGFPFEFASSYARAVNNIAFPTTFRIRSLDITWDAESEGVSLSMQVINYIEVRADAELPEGEETPPEPVEAKPPDVIVEDF